MNALGYMTLPKSYFLQFKKKKMIVYITKVPGWMKCSNISKVYSKLLVNSIIFNLEDKYASYYNRASIAMLEINKVCGSCREEVFDRVFG